MATPNFGQVGHQRNFAVRYRADDVFLFQPAAPFNQSRPRLPASQPLDFVLLEEVLQDHAIQIVEIDPRNLALLTLAIAGPYPRRQRSVNSTQLISKPLSLPQLVASAITELRQSPTVPNVSKAPCLHTSRFEFHQLRVSCWTRTAGSSENGVAMTLAPAATKNPRQSSLSPIRSHFPHES